MGSNITQANKLEKLDTVQDKIISNLLLQELDHGKGFSSCVHHRNSLKGNAFAAMSVPLQPCIHDHD